MSNKTLTILAAALIAAAIFANTSGISSVNSPSVATTHHQTDSLMRQHIVNSYNQRIARTVRCLVGAGTAPSLVTQQANKLYNEREQACKKTTFHK